MTCDPDHADCNHDEKDGCEVDLNTPANCGACGANATSCTNGLAGAPPEDLFDCGTVAEGLAVDATTLYVMCDGALLSTPKAGGAKTKLTEGEWTYADAGLQLDGGFLYWAWRSTAKTGRVRRMPVAGGPVEDVITGVNPGSNVVVHAGVAYVVDADFDGARRGHVVDSTGRVLLECDPSASLAALGEVLYVSDRFGLQSVGFDGTDAKKLGSRLGLVASNGTVVVIAGSGRHSTYQPDTGFDSGDSLGFAVDGLMVAGNDDVAWARGIAKFDGTWPSGHAVLAGIDLKSRQVRVRAAFDTNAGLFTPGRTIAAMAQDADWVYFAASGGLLQPATISRVRK